MSILIKAGVGLAAGVVAGALGLAFVPRVEPNALQPRNAVEKPQFVVAAASSPAPVRAAPALAVAVASEAAAPTPAATPESKPAVTTKPAVTAKPAPAASPVVTAKLDPPKAAPSPTASATPLAVAAPSPKPSASPAPPAPASEAAARWSVQGLVALSKGDLSSARQFLARAAEAGDPRAWVALADTYDPAMLNKLGVVGAPGDPQRARDYLGRAAAAGVSVAKDRMAAADQESGPVR